MTDLLLLSHLLQWAVLAVLAVLVIQLSRRQRPAARTLERADHGVEVGQPFPRLQLAPLEGPQVDLVRPGTPGSLVVFSAVGCPGCARLYPELELFLLRHAGLTAVVLMMGEREAVRGSAREHALELPVVPVSGRELVALRTQAFPFAYFLSPEGTVLARGVVNDEAQLGLLLADGLRNGRRAKARAAAAA